MLIQKGMGTTGQESPRENIQIRTSARRPVVQSKPVRANAGISCETKNDPYVSQAMHTLLQRLCFFTIFRDSYAPAKNFSLCHVVATLALSPSCHVVRNEVQMTLTRSFNCFPKCPTALSAELIVHF